MRRVGLVVLGLMLTTASGAYAQESKGYVMGLGGITFGNETAGVFGAELGGSLGRNLVVFAEGGRMLNVTPEDFQNDVEAIGFETKVPATYFGAGAKYVIPSQANVNFYLAGSAGVARVKAEITLDGDDIVEDLIDEGIIDEDDVKSTEFYFALGGGIQGNLGANGLFDIGYRFVKIDEANISRVTAGIGFRF